MIFYIIINVLMFSVALQELGAIIHIDLLLKILLSVALAFYPFPIDGHEDGRGHIQLTTAFACKDPSYKIHRTQRVANMVVTGKSSNCNQTSDEPKSETSDVPKSAENDGRKEDDEGDCKGIYNFINVTIDPHALECFICTKLLRPPLYQCTNGHVACFRCYIKLNQVCSICTSGVALSRSLALEKIIKSIKVPCSYTNYGCKENISYAWREDHEESCPCAPCLCPSASCSFLCSPSFLLNHILVEHKSSTHVKFTYNSKFMVYIEATESFMVLQGEDNDHTFLLMKSSSHGNNGCAFWIVRIEDAAGWGWNFTCELTVRSPRAGKNLHLEFWPTILKRPKGDYGTDPFLFVPTGFSDTPSGKIYMDIVIRKTKSILLQ